MPPRRHKNIRQLIPSSSRKQVLISSNKRRYRKIPVTGHERTSIRGKRFWVEKHTRHIKFRPRKVVLPAHQMVFTPVTEDEMRAINRVQPEGRMRVEELKPYLTFKRDIIPPPAIPGRLTDEEMHELGYTRPSLVEYLRYDRRLGDFVVDNRLLHPEQPVLMIKGVDIEVANQLNSYGIYTVADYERAIKMFIEQNPDAKTIAEARTEMFDARMARVKNMWADLNPAAQREIYDELDDLSAQDPAEFPEGYALRQLEFLVSEAFVKQKMVEEAVREKRPHAGGRPKQEKTIKELKDERLKILTDKNKSTAVKNRMVGKISREISQRQYLNKLNRLVSNIDAIEEKLGGLTEAERFVLAAKVPDKATKKAIKNAQKEVENQGSYTIGNITYQPRNLPPRFDNNRPVQSLVDDRANNIDTFIFIDKEPIRDYVLRGQKARLYDPLYNERDDVFYLQNKQVNYIGTRFQKGEKIERMGGRTYYSKDDINTVLAAIDDRHIPYPPAQFIAENEETRTLPYLIMGGHGKPLVFTTKQGYFSIQPTKIVNDDTTKRREKAANL